jgi:transposase-like protein
MTVRSNSRSRWSEENDAELLRLVAAREPPAAIAKKMGRTQDAVRGRAAQLGIMLPSSIRPWRQSHARGPRKLPRLLPEASGTEPQADE